MLRTHLQLMALLGVPLWGRLDRRIEHQEVYVQVACLCENTTEDTLECYSYCRRNKSAALYV